MAASLATLSEMTRDSQMDPRLEKSCNNKAANTQNQNMNLQNQNGYTHTKKTETLTSDDLMVLELDY